MFYSPVAERQRSLCLLNMVRALSRVAGQFCSAETHRVSDEFVKVSVAPDAKFRGKFTEGQLNNPSHLRGFTWQPEPHVAYSYSLRN